MPPRRLKLKKEEIARVLEDLNNYKGSIKEFSTERGISEQNIYRWKRQYKSKIRPNQKTMRGGAENMLFDYDSNIGNRDSDVQNLKVIIAELYLKCQKLESQLAKSQNRTLKKIRK